MESGTTGTTVFFKVLCCYGFNPFEDFTQPHSFLVFLSLPQVDLGVAFSCFGGGVPSIAATSSSFLPDIPVSPDLPGPPGCFVPVTDHLNGV